MGVERFLVDAAGLYVRDVLGRQPRAEHLGSDVRHAIAGGA
jgi:hypothetical protein